MLYVAGPFTKGNPIHNTIRAVEIADKLIERGYACIIPHMSLYHQAMSPKRTGFFWYGYDLEFMYRCDAVYRMKGKSWGADLEVRKALERGMEVIYEGEPGDPLLEETLTDWMEAA